MFDSSLQVEAPHGKRSKIKSSSIMLRFDRPPPADFMSQAQAAAGELDVDFLWQCSNGDEFAFGDLAREYFGHDPSPAESAAVLICLHGAPMYFYKKGKGRYKPATADNLRAAKAGLERKRREEEQRAAWVAELLAGRLPAPIEARWRDLPARRPGQPADGALADPRRLRYLSPGS